MITVRYVDPCGSPHSRFAVHRVFIGWSGNSAWEHLFRCGIFVGMVRAEHYHDPTAPAANSLAPSAFAVVRAHDGRILLVRRMDSGNWELPGGRVDFGESATAAAIREVAEESGVTIKVTGLSGVYTDPGHVMVYPGTGEVRQQFAVCFHAEPVGGEPRPDGRETDAADWFDPELIDRLPMHRSMWLRVEQAIAKPERAHIS